MKVFFWKHVFNTFYDMENTKIQKNIGPVSFTYVFFLQEQFWLTLKKTLYRQFLNL